MELEVTEPVVFQSWYNFDDDLHAHRADGICMASLIANSKPAAVLADHGMTVNAHGRRIDPTRTTTLQNAFIAEMNRRFTRLKKEIVELVLRNDTFGLDPNKISIFRDLGPGELRFATDAVKLAEFDEWLTERIDDGVLIAAANGDQFTDVYIGNAYDRGTKRARTELEKQGFFASAGVGTPISDVFNIALSGPVRADRVALLFTRTFNEVTGLTDDMKNRMRRTLAEGIATGSNPREVARLLANDINISRRKAIVIARTEIVRAHHSGNMAELRAAGVEGIQIFAEWTTAGDDRVCPDCDGMAGRVLTIQEAEVAIPLHPQCRCVAVPVFVGGPPPRGREKGSPVIEGEEKGLFSEVTGVPEKPGFDLPTTNAALQETLRNLSVGSLQHMINTAVHYNLLEHKDALKGKTGKRGGIGFGGATGKQGPPGESIVGKRGPQGWGGPKGDTVIGNHGRDGKDGKDGLTPADGKDGKDGHVGMRGKPGKPAPPAVAIRGKVGPMGPVPNHELKALKGSMHVRFEKPDGSWCDWVNLKINAHKLPPGAQCIEAIQIKGRRIKFFFCDGTESQFFRMGGGGGSSSSGGLSTVFTDNTIEGDGSSLDPLRYYGVMNSLIDQDIVVKADQVMINHGLIIGAGSSIDVEAGGAIILLQPTA